MRSLWKASEEAYRFLRVAVRHVSAVIPVLSAHPFLLGVFLSPWQ